MLTSPDYFFCAQAGYAKLKNGVSVVVPARNLSWRQATIKQRSLYDDAHLRPASRDKFSEKFSASTVSSKEKAGVKKKMNIEIAYEGILVSRIEGPYETFEHNV